MNGRAAKTASTCFDYILTYIIQRDGGKCHICGKKPKGKNLTLDHLIPLARGGTHAPENLRVACLSYNCRKGPRAANEQLMLIG